MPHGTPTNAAIARTLGRQLDGDLIVSHLQLELLRRLVDIRAGLLTDAEVGAVLADTCPDRQALMQNLNAWRDLLDAMFKSWAMHGALEIEERRLTQSQVKKEL